MITEQSLLELLAIQMGCEYLSDLRYLTIAQRNYLVQKLIPLSPRQEDLRDWNKVLTYLTGEPAEKTALAAKARLIEFLSAVKEADGSDSQKHLREMK